MAERIRKRAKKIEHRLGLIDLDAPPGQFSGIHPADMLPDQAEVVRELKEEIHPADTLLDQAEVVREPRGESHPLDAPLTPPEVLRRVREQPKPKRPEASTGA